VRPDEVRHEPLCLGTRGFRIAQPIGKLAHMLVERRRNPQEAAVLGQQIVEVNRSLLCAGELLRQDRTDRPPDDRRFDHRAGVDADDSSAVVDGIEEVGAIVRIDRVVAACRIDGGSCRARQRFVRPGVAIVRMRPDENVEVAEDRVIARPQRGDPPADERHLGIRFRDEARGAGEQDERPRVRQANACAELLAAPRRRLHEPLVEQLRAGDRHLALGHVVVILRFPLLRLVPDQHQVRFNAKQPLVREVVPAGDARGGPDTKRPCCLDPVHLLGGHFDQRRDEKHVRPLLAQHVGDLAAHRNRPVCRHQHALRRTHSARTEPGNSVEPAVRRWTALALDSLAQCRRRCKPRVQVADEVHRPADASGDVAPHAAVLGDNSDYRDSVRVRLQPAETDRLFLTGRSDRNRHHVPARCQLLDRGVIEAEVLRGVHDEQDLHELLPRRSMPSVYRA
jgi:hypothetical protein